MTFVQHKGVKLSWLSRKCCVLVFCYGNVTLMFIFPSRFTVQTRLSLNIVVWIIILGIVLTHTNHSVSNICIEPSLYCISWLVKEAQRFLNTFLNICCVCSSDTNLLYSTHYIGQSGHHSYERLIKKNCEWWCELASWHQLYGPSSWKISRLLTHCSRITYNLHLYRSSMMSRYFNSYIQCLQQKIS